MEELENLEETLNESIQESIGARAGRICRGKGKGATEDDDEFLRYLTIAEFFLEQKTSNIHDISKIDISSSSSLCAESSTWFSI